MATEASEDKVNLVAKEIEISKSLGSNEPKTRSDIIEKIKQLLLKYSGDTSDAFQLNNYLYIWRGLFYFMWIADKPLPQENDSEKISNLIHVCTSHQGKILFLDAFFLTVKDNMMLISKHHIDTFLMLVRQYLRQLLFTFVNCDWDLAYINQFSEVLYRALKFFTLSLRTHLQDIFLEELAKVSRGKVPPEALVIILDSFLHYISELNDITLIREVTQNVFRNRLSQLPDLEMLEAKFQGGKKMGEPGNSYNDLELIEGDIADNRSNERNDNLLDPGAENVSVEIPHIKFNPKDVVKVLNKYLTEVDCTRNCLLEITELIKWYNCLEDNILPYKPKDLKLNSQVLKQKNKKKLPKMVKEEVKKLDLVDSKMKKSCREEYNHNNYKSLDKIGEIVVKHGNFGKSMWKVSKVDNVNTLRENFNLNKSWTVSEETKNDDTKTVGVNDDEPLHLVPAGFNVEVSETQEKIPLKVQKKISLTPNFKSSTVDLSKKKRMNSNKFKSNSPISKINDEFNRKKIQKQNSPFVKIGMPKTVNANHRKSWSVSADNIGSAAKKVKKICSPVIVNINHSNGCLVSTDNDDSACKKVKKSIESAKVFQSVNGSPFNNESSIPVNRIKKRNQIYDLAIIKMKQHSKTININLSLNKNWSVCSDEKLNLSKCKSLVSNAADETNNKSIQKSNSPSVKIGSPVIVNINLNNGWLVSADNDRSASKKMCSPVIVNTNHNNGWLVLDNDDGFASKKVENSIELDEKEKSISVIKPDNSSESPESPNPVKRVLRQRTILIPKEKPDGQQMILNKALEKIPSEGFSSPRRSLRLSIKADSANKRV